MKILFWDLESTALNANWGRILSASFVSNDGKPYSYRIDRKPCRGTSLADDSALAVKVREEIEDADVIVGWNSILFDIPLLNARLALCDERAVQVGEKYAIINIDLMYYAGGGSMRIGSKKLENVGKYFSCKQNKTPLDGDTWQRASMGKKEALDLVVEHCEADVTLMYELWPRLAPFVQKHQFTLAEVWNLLGEIPSRKK